MNLEKGRKWRPTPLVSMSRRVTWAFTELRESTLEMVTNKHVKRQTFLSYRDWSN